MLLQEIAVEGHITGQRTSYKCNQVKYIMRRFGEPIDLAYPWFLTPTRRIDFLSLRLRFTVAERGSFQTRTSLNGRLYLVMFASLRSFNIRRSLSKKFCLPFPSFVCSSLEGKPPKRCKMAKSLIYSLIPFSPTFGATLDRRIPQQTSAFAFYQA